jgi:beta-galactosidase
MVTVSIADSQGRVVPVANHAVKFELEGPGRIIGVGNGDPSCHEPDVYVSAPTLRTIPVGGWRWKEVADTYAANLPEAGVQFDDAAWAKTDVQADAGPLKLRGRGVFRTRFTISAADLASPGVELWFGKIEGDASVYLNGQKIGGGGDPRSATIFDVKTLLHSGENTVAIAITTYGDTGGVNKGVQVRLVGNPPAVAWSRSVFNGFAQVIVQSSREPGALKLTARAEGLKPATVTVQANPATPRPAVP